MPKKIISLDELSRFKSKYDTKVSGELALKADKTGPLPLFDLGTDGYDTGLGDFISGNNLMNKPFIIQWTSDGDKYTYIGIIAQKNDVYTFEFEEIANQKRYVGEIAIIDFQNTTFGDILSYANRQDFEEVANKVTSLSGSSTDKQYPSAKCVYDIEQNLREVAEGKCKAYKVSYTETEPTQENFIANRWKRIDGTPIATWNDFVEWTTTSDNVRMTYANPDFNSSNEELDLSPSYFITTTYIVVRDEDVNMGDIVLITQLNVPDRWVSGEGFYNVLESTSLDPSGYVDDHTIAPAYSNQLTYAVGDLVIYDHKLYRCITAVSSAENFDSTKWTQASVSDTFYDKYHSVIPNANNTYDLGNDTYRWKYVYVASGNYAGINFGTNAYIRFDTNNGLEIRSGGNRTRFNSNVVPTSEYSGTYDLGASYAYWKDLYLSGGFNPNASGYKLTLPNTSALTANKEIATTDYFSLKRIAYDDYKALGGAEKLALLDEGCQIIGTVGTVNNPILFPRHNYGSYHQGIAIGDSIGPFIGSWEVVGSTPADGSGINLRESNGGIRIIDSKVRSINGKTIPDYPSNTGTFVLKCVNGVLTWVAE